MNNRLQLTEALSFGVIGIHGKLGCSCFVPETLRFICIRSIPRNEAKLNIF